MCPVVEYEDVAVRQGRRGMLPSHGRSTELPEDPPGLARDTEHRRGRPVAGKDVAVRQLQDTVALGPQGPRRLDLGDAVLDRIEMLPGAPLPDRLTSRRHLGQVVGV